MNMSALGERRGALMAGAAAVGVLVVGAGVALAQSGDSAPARHIDGTVLVTDIREFIPGSSCSGPGAFADIAAGTSVTVRNAEGKIIGSSTLQTGRGVRSSVDNSLGNFGPNRNRVSGCTFRFVVPVADADFYQVQIGGRAAQTYTRDQLSTQDWWVQLGLGGPAI